MVNSLNNNLSSLQARNYLDGYSQDLSQTLSNISSGLSIVHPSQDSAKFITSEQLRSQISDISQAQKNTDNAISMIQLAESGLNEINELLVNMRRVAIHSANDAVNDDFSLAANQTEIDDSIQELDSILSNLSFGKRSIFKQESGTNVVVDTNKVEFIAASEKTKSSGVDGYSLKITGLPTASRLDSRRKLSNEEIEDGGVKFNIVTDNHNYEYETKPQQTAEDIIHGLNAMFTKNNEQLMASVSDAGIISVEHKQLGSKHRFQIAASVDGLFTPKANELVNSLLGEDVRGTIGADLFRGEGAYIYGKLGGRSEGLVLKLNLPYEVTSKTLFDDKGRQIITEEFLNEEEELPLEIGRIFVTNRSLTYHSGSQAGELVKFDMPEINSTKLARHVVNGSAFESLKDIKVTKFNHAQDSLLLINKAIDEITVLRGDIGSFQRNFLERNQYSLSEEAIQVTDAESKIRDMDMAKASINLAKQQLQQGAATEALRHSNIRKADVLRLFRN